MFRIRVLHLIVTVAAITAVGALGCAGGEELEYTPVANASATVAGRVAAEYSIPPNDPKGEIKIASFGFAKLGANGVAADATVRAIHLREIITNNSDHVWSLDTRDQKLLVAGAGVSSAAFAAADPGSTPPVMAIAPNSTRRIDLFFPLPARLAHGDALPMFDAVWRVRTGSADADIVSERTPFERIVLTAPDATAFPYDYACCPYWYDPSYPSSAFYDAPVLPPQIVNRGVVVLDGFHTGTHKR